MSRTITTNFKLKILAIQSRIRFFGYYNINIISIQILNILLGFFTATALSTIPAQTGDWGIVAAAIIVTNQEIISKIIYQYKSFKYMQKISLLNIFLKYCNYIKIGILYGLFVDAFKLGS